MTKGQNVKRRFIPLIAVVAVLALAGCSQINTEPDQAGLHYKAGPLSNTKFANCVDPGTRNFDGPSDAHYSYPAGQRSYVFNGGKNEDIDPFSVPSSDNVELTVFGTLTFNLNTNCEVLRAFHEQIGLKFQPIMDGDTTAEGWDKLLAVYLKTPLQKAITQATAGLTWKELYNDPTVERQWASSVAASLPDLVKNATGGKEFFDHFNITLQKPAIPKALQSALEDAQTAVQQNLAQKQRNIQVDSELESIKKLVAILGPAGYNVYQAIKEGKISILPVPDGSNLVVPGSK